MMGSLREFQEKIRAQEEKRIGDIYLECVRRGCKEDFLRAFDTRIWFYPIEQTVAFLDRRKNGMNGNHLKQWKIYLQVMLEKRPGHKKVDEWEKALKMLD